MQKRKFWCSLLCVSCILVNVCWKNDLSASPIDQFLSKLSGKIVFQSDRDGDWEIFAMNADGSKLVQLTQNSVDDEYPVWSPDGTQIAFKSNRQGNFDIYVMNADGTDQRAVTQHPANDEDPAWSPDGEWLAFHSDRESNIEIFLIKPDGSGLRSFTRTLGKNALPAWSPDGQYIAYTGNRYLGWNVYVTDLEQKTDERITDGHGACRPDWSPDGKKLAYVSEENSEKSNIWIMNPDGSERWNLTEDSLNYNYYPAWSPDGQYLVYAKSPEKERSNWDLYISTADGHQQVQLTDQPAQEKFPDWHSGEISDELFTSLTSFEEVLYEVEDAPRMIGVLREDSQASNGQAAYAKHSASPGFLAYGPYTNYQAGRYRILFRLKARVHLEADQPAVAIDITAERGENTLARRELLGRQFAGIQGYQEFQFEIELREPATLEFRVYSFGTADVWADVITVRSLD